MKITTRHAWRRTWNLWGPLLQLALLPLALAAGLVVGILAAALLQ